MLIIFMKIDFSNKKAVVVGSSKGIGKGVYTKFKSLGADVIGISRSKGIDISIKEDIDEFFKKIKKIDFLINVAGINYCKKINELITAKA